MPFEVIWYFVIGLAVSMYVVLDGFDMGVGMLHLFVKKDEERRLFLNAIGPVWDGNELWLVIVGGALFAGFPAAYATLFSGYYNLCMAFLAAIIFRAAGIEFRSKRPSKTWRRLWDFFFSLASYLIAFGLGVVLGNFILGVPLDAQGNFSGSLALFLRPYALLIGLLSVSVFMMHGSLFLLMKTEGDLHDRIRAMGKKCIFIFTTLYLITTGVTLFALPYMASRMLENPFWFVIPFITLFSIANVPRLLSKKKDGLAFIFSSLSIFFLFLLYGVGTYPNLVRSSVETERYSLNLYNAASSTFTLKILLLIVLIGIPLVLGYGYFVYRTFRGKVKIGPTSY